VVLTQNALLVDVPTGWIVAQPEVIRFFRDCPSSDREKCPPEHFDSSSGAS
jgi:hypothetical protein